MSRSKTAFPNIGNLEVLNAVLYIWAKKGVLHLQQLGNIQVQVNEVSLDSTCIKVHPDGMGALKKVGHSPSGEHEEDGIPNFIWPPHLIGMG